MQLTSLRTFIYRNFGYIKKNINNKGYERTGVEIC